MNGKHKGDDNGTKEGKVTPISPEVARKLVDQERNAMKAQLRRDFASYKPNDRQLMAEAMNEVLNEEARALQEAEKSVEEEIEDFPQYVEPEQTLGSKFKGVVGNNVSGFSEMPLRHLVVKALKWGIPIVMGCSALLTGVGIYSDPAKRTTVEAITGPFKTAWEAVTIAGGTVYDNSTMFIYGAAAALTLTIFNRPTVSKKFGRAFYAGLFASTPTVFNDLVTNMQNGASTIGEKIDLSFMGNISIVALSAALILSWITPKFPKHDEDKATSPKKPSKVALALGAVTGGLSWAIFNAMGVVARTPGNIISAVRNKLASRKESAESVPTEEMPADVSCYNPAGTPPGGLTKEELEAIGWKLVDTTSTEGEEEEGTEAESLPTTEELDSPTEEPEEAPEEATTPEPEEVAEEEPEGETENGDILIPLDE